MEGHKCLIVHVVADGYVDDECVLFSLICVCKENALQNIVAVFFGIVFEFQRPSKDANMGPRID